MAQLKHIGTPRHSGRYPWGSGEDPNQRNSDFLGYVSKLQKEGLKETEIAEGLGMSTSQLRAKKSIAKSEKRMAESSQALRLKTKGYSNIAIGQRMGLNESSVRALLDPILQERANETNVISNMLRKTADDKKYIDVGSGVETHIGISRTKLNTALALLEEEGYKVHYVKVQQLGTGKYTTIKVLAPPETPYSEVYKNRDNIKMVTDRVVVSNGKTSVLGIEPPTNISSSRISIRHKEEGGEDKDGVIELRRGVEDISLANSKYAQVRIAVDGTHFLKGMAMYSDDIPNGVDLVFNTNKPLGTPKEKVFKSMVEDADNPFGSVIRQRTYIGKDGKEHLSALNIVNEEGEWANWSKNISSQVLSKQTPALAKKQLGLALDLKNEEFEELGSLTNPSIKKRLLDSFADDCDSAAVHLKAAALPRQASHVILPFPTIKENEIYAPNFLDGEHVVLIRHPHGGPFEIPQLIVNNNNREANRSIKNAIDAIGINPKVAERLSGADFDGDTVIVIPNKNGSIKTSSSLKGLKGFNPKETYPGYEGMTRMSARTKQMKMGDISNLITDMTIKGANEDEIARAVRHSMVVIDAEKHNLNYKQSAIDNGIAGLKKKYQGSERSGASTLISKASSEVRVGERAVGMKPDPKTGEKIYKYTNESFINAKGKIVQKTTISTKMAEAKDAFDLSSGTRMESIYASHANNLKALANKARKLAFETQHIPYSPSAKNVYTQEVSSLKSKLNIAFRNKPLERQAQLLANKVLTTKRQANPNMEAADLKKIKGQALEEARTRTGAKKQKIIITDKEWDAIQAGAISTNTLSQILLNTDLDLLKQRALPRTSKSMTPAKLARAHSMLASGYTSGEIANALGVSVATLQTILK